MSLNFLYKANIPLTPISTNLFLIAARASKAYYSGVPVPF